MKKLFIILILPFVCVINLNCQSTDGFPLANFALTLNASNNGDLFNTIYQNTGKLGSWLSHKGSIKIALSHNNETFFLSDFETKHIQRLFPFVNNLYKDLDNLPVELHLQSFCPIAINDAFTSSLPAVIVKMNFENISDKQLNFGLVFMKDSICNSLNDKECFINGFYSSTEDVTFMNKVFINNSVSFNIDLSMKETKEFIFVISFFDEDWYSALFFDDAVGVNSYVCSNIETLEKSVIALDRAIPTTNDNKLDEYLRWYMTPAISLTRITKNNEILTLGYCELNQRDSYFTTWVHLVFFPELEKKMIKESAEAQSITGKIPTTILPLIERNDDLDINAFFILRIARYYYHYKDTLFLKEYLPAAKKAMNWLVQRGIDGNGLPAQVSFWGDWKDVKGIENRRYSPFSCLLYLASLKEISAMCCVTSDSINNKKFQQIYESAFTTINKSIDEGGMWNGNFYCQIMKDGSCNHKLLQDQTIGIMFGVVPEEKANKILDALIENNLTIYGIAETYPYYDDSFGYPQGTYHNGAVWPWLSFVDAWARIKTHRVEEAIYLIKKVSFTDLELYSDWSPNEHINSITGENLGFQLQGWNANLFGLIYFGLSSTKKN